MAFDNTKPAYQGPLNSQPIRDNFNALKDQVDVEHNEDGTHKDALKASGDTMTGGLVIKMDAPELRLIGTEGSANDIRMVESSGDLYIQKNTGTEATPSWSTILKLNAATLLIETARINEANLADGTAIPDSKLDMLTTPGKVAATALPASVVQSDEATTFSQPITLAGSVPMKIDNASDTTYYATLYKTPTSGEVRLQIRRKTDSVSVKDYTFSSSGQFTATTVKATEQLISTVATGTPPLAVSSTTTVPNLKSNYCTLADNTTLFDGHPLTSFSCSGACVSQCTSCAGACWSCTGSCTGSCLGTCQSTCTDTCDAGCGGCNASG